MENLRNRRRFLQLAGTGAAASIAGCSSLGLNDGQDGNGDDGDDANGDGEVEATDVPDSALTAVAQPDQEALQELQSDLNQQMEDGDLSQQEAQQEYQQQQTELITEATTELETELEETDGLSVEGSIGEVGAVLVDGDAEAMRSALNEELMNALIPGAEFAAIQQQQQLQAQMEAQAEADAESGDEDADAGEEDGDNESADE